MVALPTGGRLSEHAVQPEEWEGRFANVSAYLDTVLSSSSSAFVRHVLLTQLTAHTFRQYSVHVLYACIRWRHFAETEKTMLW